MDLIPDKTPISSIPLFIANIQFSNEPALHAGYFNAFLDRTVMSDGRAR